MALLGTAYAIINQYRLRDKKDLMKLALKPAAAILSLALAVGALGGCGAQTDDQQNTDTAVSTEFSTGVFTNYVNSEGMAGYVSSLEMGYGNTNTLFERNTLVLTDNADSDRGDIATAKPYIDTSTTKRYELTKDFYVGSKGIHRIAMFYGTWTNDDMEVTLETPEYWSYVDYEGDGYYSFNKDESCDFMVRTGEEGTAGDISLRFGGPVLQPFADSGNEPQTVTVNMEDYTFEYPAGDTSDDDPVE
ncbi:hypothetical protein BLEM_1618 [Bifidobacterium lemurum]|uniref:Uncharacterized protein n=1 Tax=Bifidobacterium lemurum TaxID=1603886 RepID=A0A261FQB2_9BIFI|nr:hypothetical protein [Bifidobacterium lemurum]OZG60986.1 hypothetical protein BLEM_1618 [Bifidobacterium lemurum]QOL34779.1 hypothetical protein BL8807_02390 [Bifidobacterium lemurum]